MQNRNIPDQSHQHLEILNFSGTGIVCCGNLQYLTVSLRDKPVRQHLFFISMQLGKASGLKHILGCCGGVL